MLHVKITMKGFHDDNRLLLDGEDYLNVTGVSLNCGSMLRLDLGTSQVTTYA